MLQRQLTAILATLQAQGYDTRPLVFERPATAMAIAAVEQQLGFPMPALFKLVLTEVASAVEFRWFAPERRNFPEPFQSSFSGDLHWSLARLCEINADREESVRVIFPDADDPYSAVWHQKLAFYEVGNGDYLALDLRPATHGQIVYLSHDDGEGHGHVLASDFLTLLKRWVPLACAGGEDWQWLPFTTSPSSGLDATGKNAMAWRQLLGLVEGG